MVAIIIDNAFIANDRVTKLINEMQNLSNAGNIMKDNKTTVYGNNVSASNAIDLSRNISKEVTEIVKTMAQNIQNISDSFQERDRQIEKMISDRPSVRGFSLNDS